MNKWSTTLIIALVTLATIGLMVIQVYWIRDAVKVKQAVFLRDLDQAMTNAIYELDKLRLEDRLKKQRQMYKQNHGIYELYDSLNNLLSTGIANINTISEINYILNKTNTIVNRANWQLSINNTDNEPGSFLVSNKDLIDSIITFQLRKHNVKTLHEFGIYSPATNSMLVQRTGAYPEQLLKEAYVYDLAPISSLFAPPNKLLLYFPYEKGFIARQIWKLLAVSIFLFLVIIFSFSFSIYIINRQKKLSVMKNDFINNMTHEFKTPISTIALACEALKDEDLKQIADVYNNYIGVINEENSRLKSMAEQILQTAIIDKGQLKLKKTVVDVDELIVNAVSSKKMAIEKKGGSIELQLKATKSVLKADTVHLTNVFINLIDNAIKYNLNKPHVIINTINKNGDLLVRVQDNGIGISKSNQKKIFEKLYRVPTGNVHNFKGFGLGLSYVKAILDLHKGDVQVDSDIEKGSTFTIRLPLKTKPHEEKK
jgi:two-component system phosphate regulon sensor histidine kinase PhoR